LVPASNDKISNNLLMAITPGDNYSLKSISAKFTHESSMWRYDCN
jgi:hypothetical protein